MNNEYDIARAFQRIEETLIKSMKRNLTRHLNEERDLGMNWSAWQTEQLKSLEHFKKDNKKIFKNDFSTINSDVEELIKQSFDNGKLDQERVILEAIKEGNFNSNDKQINKMWHIYRTSKNKRIKKKQLTRIFEKTEQAESNFFRINERKLNALIKETTRNFQKAELSILRYTNDQYRKIIYDAQVYANTGSGTIQQAVDMATKDFLSKGINSIEYSDGKMVNIASYAEMAIRTANKRAYLQGEGTKRAEWGIHTVLVPNRGGGCPYCIKFQGKVFIDDVWSGGTAAESNETGYPLLSTAVKARLFHPNCKDTAVTYFPGINSEVTPPTRQQLKQKEENYKNEQKLNYIDRNIDKYSRLELGSIDTENAEKYHNKRLQWQEYKEKFKQDHITTFSDIIEAEKARQQEFIKSKVIGHIVNDVEIRDVSKHLVDRVRQREIELDDIIDTLKNPLKCGKIEYDEQQRPSFKTIGEKTTLYINPESGIITTVHKTHTKTAEKLKGKNNNATKN
jgi:hypothetical protein|nr:MAG TPA: minor capsid protein [Caudoviricetes sp.]